MNAITTAYRAARKTGHSAKSAISIARESARIDEMGLPRYPADAVITLNGTMFTIKVETDFESSPFEGDCYYGIPEETRYRRELDPGHTLILSGGRTNYDYHRVDAIAECLLQNPQWPRCTRFEQACEAVDAEIDYWRKWLNDDRYFIDLTVTAESSEGFTADSSLWGIEAGDHEGYWRSIASDLISDCQHEITQQRVDLACALDDALTADFAGIQFA